MTLEQFKLAWQDTPDFHTNIHNLFTDLVNKDPLLDAHRSYIDAHIFGMGERSFQYLWKILVESLPENPKLLEIGCHKGQILSLWRLLRDDATVYGITPLDGRGTGWTEDDYAAHIRNIHNDFELEQPTLFVGISEDENMLELAKLASPFDVLYVDGDHSFDIALSDLVNYSPLVKQGGYVVIDDCNCNLNFPPSGFFTGIDTVTEAKKKWLSDFGDNWEFWGSVVHISIYRRK